MQTLSRSAQSVAEGFLAIWVDQGAGPQAALPAEEMYSYQKYDSVVLEECYFSFVSVQVENKNRDGWFGSVSYSSDGGATFLSMVCTSGCDEMTDTSALVVDGDSFTGLGCYGKRCTIQPRK